MALVNKALNEMYGGEIIVPKLLEHKNNRPVQVLGSELTYHITGIRAGEKLHEVMIPEEEMRNAVDMGAHYIIQPNRIGGTSQNIEKWLRRVAGLLLKLKNMQVEQIVVGSAKNNLLI